MRVFARRVAGVVDRISVFIGYACVALYFVCIALSVFEVIMRYVFASPTQWTFETVMVLCATGWVMASGYVTQQQRHIAVTTLRLNAPRHTWRWFDLLSLVLSIIAIAFLLYASWGPAVEAMHPIQRSGSAFDPPLPTYLKVLLVAGCITYLLQLLANLIHWFDATDGGEHQ